MESVTSPAAPPIPVGSGHCENTGRQESAVAKQQRAERDRREPDGSAGAEGEAERDSSRKEERKDNSDDCEAEELHREVGEGGARQPENIFRRSVHHVAEAWIVDVPGDEASERGGRDRDQRKAAKAQTVSAQEIAQPGFHRQVLVERVVAHSPSPRF